MIDAYKIGVSIAMTNGVSAILGVMQRDVLGLKKAVDFTTEGFNKMKLAAVGFAAVTVGAGMLAGLAELSKASEKYTHQLELMKIAGMSVGDMNLAISAANSTSSKVMTSTPTQNLQTIGELRSVFGDTKEAIQFLPQMQQLSAVFASITGGTPEKLGYTTMRGVEMMGGTVNPKTGQMDVGRASTMVDLITQAVIASHGKVGPQEWLQFAQQASGVVKKMDPSALILGMMPIIQEMGGFRAGTALTSMNQQIVGGVMPQRVVADWEKFGLIDMSKVTETKTGVRVGPGGIVGEETWKRNPLEWIESVFIPKLHAQGVKDEDISDQIIRLFSRQTSQREASLMATQLVRINKDVAMAQAAATSAPGATELISNDPNSVRTKLDSQRDRLITDIGRAITPTVIAAMNGLAKAFRYIAEIVEAHPTATKWILSVAAALGAFLVVAGTIAIGVAAIAAIGAFGWIPIAVAAVVTAIGALGVAILAYWDKIKGAWSSAMAWLSSFDGAYIRKMIADVMASISTAILAWRDRTAAAIIAWVSGMGSAVLSWFASHDLGGIIMHGMASISTAILNWIGGLASAVWNWVKHPLGGADASGAAPGTAQTIANGFAPPGGFGQPAGPSFSHAPLTDDHADRIGNAIASKINGATVNLDGRKVGSLLFNDIGTAPPATGSNFDTRLSPLFPSTGYK